MSRRSLIFAAVIGWLAHDGINSQTKCPSTAGSYAVTLFQASGPAICGTLDPYSFTITNGFIQIRTHFVDTEIPTGIIDGKNATFRLSGTPAPITSVKLYWNGIRQTRGQDFTLTPNGVITVLTTIPGPGDKLTVDYRK